MLNLEGFTFPSGRAIPALRKGCRPAEKTGGLTWLLAIVANLRVIRSAKHLRAHRVVQ